MHNLGVHYRERGLYDQAEPLLREAAERARAKLTINHPYTQRFIQSVAVLYDLRGNSGEAATWRKELEAIRKK
jgi:hypothetical protein